MAEAKRVPPYVGQDGHWRVPSPCRGCNGAGRMGYRAQRRAGLSVDYREPDMTCPGCNGSGVTWARGGPAEPFTPTPSGPSVVPVAAPEEGR